MTESTNDIDHLSTWIGRQEATTDTISTAACRRLQHTLDRDATLQDGDRLPPLWHFITHLASVPHHRIGRDGHPERGGFLPPVALPRRMWAGSRLTFLDPIVLGGSVTKTSTIQDVTMKSGRSGQLCFVSVLHEFDVDGDVRLREEQNLVYRNDPEPGAPTPEPKPAPTDAQFSRTVTPDEVMLFRYSALTFNGHRIHYDRAYARDVEGYPGLVVHGPLTATLLADLAVAESGCDLATFSFRALSPLFAGAPYTVAGSIEGDTAHVWAANPTGGLAMQGDATLRRETP